MYSIEYCDKVLNEFVSGYTDDRLTYMTILDGRVYFASVDGEYTTIAHEEGPTLNSSMDRLVKSLESKGLVSKYSRA